MPEYEAKQFLFPNFKTPITGTLKEVLENYTKPRNKISLNELVTTKYKYVSAYMILKTGMELA